MRFFTRGQDKILDGVVAIREGQVAQNYVQDNGNRMAIVLEDDGIVFDVFRDIELIEVFSHFYNNSGVIVRGIEGIIVKLEDIQDLIAVGEYYELDKTKNWNMQPYKPTSFFVGDIMLESTTPANLIPYPIYPFRMEFIKEWNGKFPYAVSSFTAPEYFSTTKIPDTWDITFTTTTFNGRPSYLIDTSMELVYLYMGQPLVRDPYIGIPPVITAKVGIIHQLPFKDTNADNRAGAWIDRAFKRVVITKTNNISVKDLTK